MIADVIKNPVFAKEVLKIPLKKVKCHNA